jgi:hypothetical protein
MALDERPHLMLGESERMIDLISQRILIHSFVPSKQKHDFACP